MSHHTNPIRDQMRRLLNSVIQAFTGAAGDPDNPDVWTVYDSSDALREGWGIFDSNGEMRLERGDAESKFDSDSAAWRHVAAQSAKGSRLHLKAMHLLFVHSPNEWMRITAHTINEGEFQ